MDEVLPLEAIAPRLLELVQQNPEAREPTSRSQPSLAHSFITCPHCHGSLTEQGVESSREYACHVGHRFSLRSLYAEQADEVESALWAAMRALEEGAAVANRLADTATGSLKERYAEKERAMKGQARTIQECCSAQPQLHQWTSRVAPRRLNETPADRTHLSLLVAQEADACSYRFRAARSA